MATYNIPSSVAAADQYSITIRESGQLDSIASVKTMLDGIGNGLLLKRNKDDLVSAGEQTSSNTYDNYQDKYVTTLHYHPTPSSVPMADEATHAVDADRATSAATADALSPGASINGKLFDGTTNITLTAHDIERVPKVYWGTVPPNQYSGFSGLQNGDLYVKIIG